MTCVARIRGICKAFEPDIVGLQCNFTTERYRTLRLARQVKHELPDAFDGFTILHLSDLHIDCLPDLADNLNARLQAFDVDLCVLTGDYQGGLDAFDDGRQSQPQYFRIVDEVLGNPRGR